MTAQHALRPVGDEFLTGAPLVIPVAVTLPNSPAEVWEVLGSERMWSWLPLIDRVRWLSPCPLRAGAIRQLRLARAVMLDEEFYRWDDERRATFYVKSASRPLLRALAEDFVLEPTAAGGTRLTWTMAVEPNLPRVRWLRWLAPLLRPGNALALRGIRRELPRRA